MVLHDLVDRGEVGLEGCDGPNALMPKPWEVAGGILDSNIEGLEKRDITQLEETSEIRLVDLIGPSTYIGDNLDVRKQVRR
jgi:hypothetical protein